MKGNVIKNIFFPFIFIFLINGCNSTSTNVSSSWESQSDLKEFLKLLENDEPYIGFFNIEKNCISNIDDNYLKARNKIFYAISIATDEPEYERERFLRFLKKNSYLKSDCLDEWEKTITILTYELYKNETVFDYQPKNIIEHRDIVYAEYPNKKLHLDLFLPTQPKNKPIPGIVAIHGGGFYVNRKIWYEPFGQYLADNGFAAVVIDYRKKPAVGLKDIVYDSKAAVRWLRANAAKYNIDPNWIGAVGSSAGGHLVSLLGTTANIKELEGNGGNEGVSTEVQAVVGIATPALVADGKNSTIKRMIGLSNEEIKQISPYENVNSKSAPLYLIHGTTDFVVKPENSQYLFDKYKEKGVHVELTWMEGEGHGFFEKNDRAIKMATKFFKEQYSNFIQK